MKILRKGSRGDEVEVLQHLLNVEGHKVTIDGDFGPKTEVAVKAFQKAHAEECGEADGIVGPRTWAALGVKTEERKDALKKSKRRIDYIVVHSTATHEGQDFTVEQIRKVHKGKGWGDIGYHYVVYRDGTLHLGRDVDLAGVHARNYNAHSIGIVYVGGCEKTSSKAKDTRTQAQKATLRETLEKLRALYPKAKIVGHKNLNATACPSFDAKMEYKDI